MDHILSHTRDLWEELGEGRLFITGGTGFSGCRLLESVLRVDDRLGLDATAVVVTRKLSLLARLATPPSKGPSLSLT